MSSSPPLPGAGGNGTGLIKTVYRRVVDNFLAVVTVPLAAAALVAAARLGPDEAGRLLRATLYMVRVQPTEPVEPARIKPILHAPYGLV